jgi:hypothetical protein
METPIKIKIAQKAFSVTKHYQVEYKEEGQEVKEAVVSVTNDSDELNFTCRLVDTTGLTKEQVYSIQTSLLIDFQKKPLNYFTDVVI